MHKRANGGVCKRVVFGVYSVYKRAPHRRGKRWLRAARCSPVLLSEEFRVFCENMPSDKQTSCKICPNSLSHIAESRSRYDNGEKNTSKQPKRSYWILSKCSRSFDYPEATCRSGAKVGIWSCMEHRFHQTSETRLNLSLRTFKSIEVVVQTRWNGKVWNCSFPCFHFGNFLGVDVLFQLEWLDSPCIWGSIHAGWRAPSAHLPGDGWRSVGNETALGPLLLQKKDSYF